MGFHFNYKLFVFDATRETYLDKSPDCDEQVEYIHLVKIGEHKDNIYGYYFGFGSTGLASLGDGYYYISHEKDDWKERIFESNITLYKWDSVSPFTKA